MRIIFMGTPDFAVPCLQSLLDAGHEVCAVFTQPDKPKGRKFVMTPPPVKELAVKTGIPVFQPTTLRVQEETDRIAGLRPDLIAVVAYGKILPKAILEIPPMGCVNVHGSLLPKYRGAAPIQWSVIRGEKITGVTTMYMAEGLDTGDILLKRETEIGPDETAGELYGRLSQIGAALIVETLNAIRSGTAHRTPQREEDASYAPMLSREMSQIDWNKPARELHDLVRGLSPWPVASTVYRGRRLKVYRTKVVENRAGRPGQILDGKDFLVCCGGNTALKLLTVQYEGGKQMDAADFLRGHPPGEQKLLT